MYLQAHVIILIVIAIIVVLLCCAWYFCFRVTDVEDVVADRDIRERQLRGSARGSQYLESSQHANKGVVPVFSNHVSNAEAPAS